jgi:hypothetical protein
MPRIRSPWGGRGLDHGGQLVVRRLAGADARGGALHLAVPGRTSVALSARRKELPSLPSLLSLLSIDGSEGCRENGRKGGRRGWWRLLTVQRPGR